ncbi:MAG TPA: hypothetical protein VMQ10_01530, partial [Spirochaetia bacterium]|nr:hypothetical protein [Spirochaetia bacterium]
NREGILPWAWGVNGALSVSGSVLTRILSTSVGFSVVLGVMAALYMAAGALFRVNGARRAVGDLATAPAPAYAIDKAPAPAPSAAAALAVRPASARAASASAPAARPTSARAGRGLLFEAEKRRRA